MLGKMKQYNHPQPISLSLVMGLIVCLRINCQKDPEVVTRLLIGERNTVESALGKLAEKQRQQIQERGDGR
ncbi:hypothetical protein V6N13_039753 [Hibiscus sabdariffa]